MNNEEIKTNVQSKEAWIRGFYILVFYCIFTLGVWIAFGVVLFQFVSVLITARTNRKLEEFGAGLSRYLYDILLYGTFNSQVLPYPFGDWPGQKE